MSTIERVPDGMPDDAGVTPVHTWTGQLFFSVGSLTRLNLEMCCSALANVGQHCERLASARTAEQVVRVHAQTMPLWSAQIAAYTQGWFDILSMATACHLSHRRDVDDVSQLRGLLDDMAWSAKGVDTMLRAMSLSTLTPDPTATPSANSPAESSAAAASTRKTRPAVPSRRNTSNRHS